MTNSEYQQLVEFLGQQFTAIDRRFDGIDQRFDGIDQRFVAIDRRFDRLDDRIDGLEQRFDAFRAEVLGHFDVIYRRLDRLEQEYQAITQALRRIEALLADERSRREILERSVAELKNHMAALQARIDEIEARLR